MREKRRAVFPKFDGGYRILVSPRLIGRPLIEPAFAQRLLHWPAGVIAPHSLLAWRDFWAFEFQHRLPAPPNWATVSEFAALGGELAERVPPPVKSTVPRGFIDRVIGRCRR